MSKTSDRYYQILKTYWRRPLILLLVVVFLLCFGNLAFMPMSNRLSDIYAEPEPVGKLQFVNSSVDEAQSATHSTDGQETLDGLLEKQNGKSIRSLCVTEQKDGDRLPDLTKVPNLGYLKLSGFDLTDDIVDQILRLPKLNSLELTSREIPAGALTKIGQHVTQLQIRSLGMEQHLDEIPKMSAVRLLTLEYENLSPELMEAITKIRHLQKLSLVPRGRKVSSQNGPLLSPKILNSLRTHPTLKDVYADWPQMEQLHQIEVQPLLPVRSFPLHYSSEKRGAVGGAGIAICLFVVMLILQLWTQFMVPAAAVVPNYLRPHRHVAVALLSFGLLLIWLSLLRYGFDRLAITSVVLVASGIMSLYISMFMIENRLLKNWIAPIFIIACFTVPTLLMQFFSGYSSEFIWYMHGYMPRLATTVSLLSIMAIAGGFRRLGTVTNKVNEKFSSLPAFSPWDAKKMKALEGQQYNNWMIRLLDRGYQQLEYRSRSTLEMVSLWRKGNLLRPIHVLFFMIFVMLLSSVPQLLIRINAGEQLFSGNPTWIASAFAGPFGIGFMMPVIGWWQRSRSLESESLKPLSRGSLCKQLYLGLALDHWLAWIGLIGMLGYRAIEAPGGWVEMGGLLILLGVAAPLWIIGVSSSVLVFNRAWVVLASMIGLYTLVAVGMGFAIAFVGSAVPGSTKDMQILYLFAIVALIAAIALNRIMYKALLRREWG